MRKLFVLLSLLVVGSMILAACGAPAPATATQPPAAETEPPVVATEPPATEEPAGALSPYIGSGQLDGNGVPPDFFADEHIRKAFSYSFDFQTYLNDVFLGEGVQPPTLALAGMPGYDPDAPVYTFDVEKAAEEFQLADLDHDGTPAGEDPEGDVWTTGFRLQMLYNQGNTSRQIIAEVYANSLSGINELFQVEVLGLPWPAYLAAQRSGQIPILTAGWLEDIHDPHNWYQPYTTGAYGNRQNMPDDLKAQFQEFLSAGVSEIDPAARHEIYQQANQLYYDQAVGIPIVVATSHGYEQRWNEGRILNPLYPGVNFYALSKPSDPTDPTTYTQASLGDADTFDPALAYDTASAEQIFNVYETLVGYDGERTDAFVPKLAESWEASEDGTTWTFNIRQGVTFHEGGDLTPSDVAYSFQRGILQGGYISPQWLLAEPVFGVGLDDVSLVAGDGSAADDREAMMATDSAALVAACEKVKSAIVADDAAGTVTFTLAQPWAPWLPTIAQSWGSVMDMEWVMENGGWDGSCDTWQNFYAMTAAEDPFTTIMNGTGPFKLDHWTQGQEIVLARNETYWGEPAALERVVTMIVEEWGTRFAMLQAGDADEVDVNRENTPQADALVGEFRVFNIPENTYDPVQPLCSIDSAALGVAKFIACGAGETGTDGPLRLYIGRPQLQMDVVIYNFAIK
jgi:ABC-type transport system substrate-binding protein